MVVERRFKTQSNSSEPGGNKPVPPPESDVRISLTSERIDVTPKDSKSDGFMFKDFDIEAEDKREVRDSVVRVFRGEERTSSSEM